MFDARQLLIGARLITDKLNDAWLIRNNTWFADWLIGDRLLYKEFRTLFQDLN